jgi:tetratricopeptide (TPR) repeat protein
VRVNLAAVVIISAIICSGCANFGAGEKARTLNQLLKQEKYDAVIAECNKTLQKTPDDAEMLAYRGLAQLKSNKPQLARADLQNAIALNPDQGWFYCGLADAYLECNQDKEALESYTKADKLLPNSPRTPAILSGMAVAHLHLDDAKQALAKINESLKLEPEQKYSYQTRALAYIDLFEYDKAVADANKSIALDDKNVGVYVTRAEAHFLAGHIEEAINDCHSALALNPKYFRALDMLLAIEIARGNDQAALKIADQLISNYPKIAAAYSDKATCLYFMQDLQAAKTLADKALMIEPDSSRALYIGMLLAAKEGNKKRALELAERQKSHQNPMRRTKNTALCLLITGDYQKAIEVLNGALTNEAKAPYIYRLRSYAYQKLNLPDLARADMQKAIEQGYAKISVLERLIASQ